MARDYAADINDPIAREIVANVGTWVDKEVKPNADEFEHADEFPEPLLKGMSDMGLFGIKIPESYGGLDLSFECYAGVCIEHLGDTPLLRCPLRIGLPKPLLQLIPAAETPHAELLRPALVL